MNLTITPINFQKFQKRNLESTTVAKSVKTASAGQISANQALTLKNQILFKGNLTQTKEELIQETIKKYNLKIKPETLDYIFNPEHSQDEKFAQYGKMGAKISYPLLKGELFKQYPEKYEEELHEIFDVVVQQDNKSKIIRKLFPLELLKNGKNAPLTNAVYARYFNALMGAIVLEGEEDGYKNAIEFFNNHIAQNVVPKEKTIAKNSFELLKEAVIAQGKSYNDIYIQTKVFDNLGEYRVFYKDLLLAKRIETKRSKTAREEMIRDLTKKINDGKVSFDGASDNLPYKKHLNPTGKRLKILNRFQIMQGLNFSDITLLNRAFLFGTMEDMAVIPHKDSYQMLEYVGDSVLDFCLEQYLAKNHSDLKEERRKELISDLRSNETLIRISKEMRLIEAYRANIDSSVGTKKHADVLEALIGAIYIDGGTNGLNNAYDYIGKIYEKEISRIIKKGIIHTPKKEASSKSFYIAPEKNDTPFKKDINRDASIQEALRKNNLRLRIATLDYVLNSKNSNDEKYKSYVSQGEKTYSKHFDSKHSSVELKSQILKILFDENLLLTNDRNNEQYANFLYALIGAIELESGKFGERMVRDFLTKNVQNIIQKITTET